MAKVLLFSDLHAHPFKAYATLTPDGLNSRLADAISCIEQIYNLAVAENVDLVLFGGDMFHVRKTINVQAFNEVYAAMAMFSMAKIPVVMIHGNHDQSDKEGEEHSIFSFRTFLNVVDTSGWYEIKGHSGQIYEIMAVPYTENVPHLRSVLATKPPGGKGCPRLFLGHLGIQGAKVGADFVYENPHDPAITDLDCSKFDAGFLGHYHLHQQLAPNFWYIGATLQHGWGDRDDPVRGCLMYDTVTKQIERYKLESPRFFEMDEQLALSALATGAAHRPGDYLRIVSDRSWSETERAAAQKQFQARSLEIVPSKQRPSVNQPARLAIEPTMGFSEMLQEYVTSGLADMNGLDEGYLLSIGQDILREAEEVS